MFSILSSVPSLAGMHPLHFLLKLQEAIPRGQILEGLESSKQFSHEGLGSWRTAGDVDINRDDPVAASDNSVAVVIVTSSVGTASHTDHPSRLGHLS